MTVFQPFTRIPGAGYLHRLTRTRGWPYLAAWIHRITGIMLVLYVWFHIFTLSALRNPETFDSKMKFFEIYVPMYLEWLLAVPVIYHALNGGRLILYEIFGNRNDYIIFKWVLWLTAAYVLLLGIFMIMGNQSVSGIFFWVYTGVASVFVTYLTMTRIRLSGASIFWKLQRISGAFLFLMIPAHMIFMHLDPALGHDALTIIDRMDNIFIKLVDLMLVVTVLYHAAYGLLGIIRDYSSSRNVRYCSTFFIVSMMVIFTWIGVKLTILI